MFGMPRSRAFLRLSLLAIGWLFAGCAHYQLGTGAETVPFRTLYIAPVHNTAALPQAVATFTRELRHAFANDGRVQLASSPQSADAVLTVDLARFDRTFTSVQPNDTALARKFDLNITARCTLADRRNGRDFFTDREIRVTRQIFVDGGQNIAEYQVQPHLAAQLADRVIHTVLDVW